MGSAIGNFYLQIKYRNFTAYVLITDMGTWKMVGCDPDSEWPQEQTWRRGTWAYDLGPARCYAMGTGADAVSSNNQTKIEVFRLSDLEFPPDISSRQGFWIKQFFISKRWAERINVSTQPVHAAAGSARPWTMKTHGSWAALISGPLRTAIELKLKELKEKLTQLFIQMGWDVASIASGWFSIPAASYALECGDYLGCCLNLLGVIPLFGRATSAAVAAKAGNDLKTILKEITFIEEWLTISIDATRRLRRTEPAGELLKVEVQGTTRAAIFIKSGEASASAAGELKNAGLIHRIFDATSLGVLPEELLALRALAQEGYFFVIRSCNPERVQWIRAALKHGWSMLAKPLCLKVKSLQTGKFAGLVGFLRSDEVYAQAIQNLRLVADLPKTVKLNWLSAKGVGQDSVKVYQATKNFTVADIKDPDMVLTHYFVDVGDSLIIVDRLGRPYLPDLDIVYIKRLLGQGRFGPAGYNVGKPNPVTSGGVDSTEQAIYWNELLCKRIRYPEGYKPIGWHGSGGGSAAYYGTFNPVTGLRPLGWNPEKNEKLIVAAQGIEQLGDDVGYASGWHTFALFIRNNPGLGEFRFDLSKAPASAPGLP